MTAICAQNCIGVGVVGRFQGVSRIDVWVGFPAAGATWAVNRILRDLIGHPIGKFGTAVVVQSVNRAFDSLA